MIKINIDKKLHGASGEMHLNLHLDIEEGSFVAIAGQSGSGKTTLLRILAGLEEAEGKIEVGEEVWLDEGRALAPQKRGIGYVFQDYALFSNMSVEQNLLFVKRDKALANYLMRITELTELKERFPNSLSGGQKQRVALCRAMMNRPKILLMDEPLSALDPVMRTKLQHEILRLHKEFGTTIIMVSHEPSEIYRLASRVLMLALGRVVSDGTPKEVLLKTTGSQKFAFEGEVLEVIRVDVLYVAIISIGQQLVEVVIGKGEAENLKIGQRISVSTKAFSPNIAF
jgi:molybdate transport system ATP-binding protein